MKSKKISINGLNYHYIEMKNYNKPKILLIHGLAVESHSWDGVIPHLEDHYHVYAIDLKGHGLSDHGKSYEKDYSPDIISEDLFIFYKEVIQEPFTIVGHSLGGQFALHYAANYPDTITNLIIVDSGPSIPLKGIFTLLWAYFRTPKVYEDINQVKKFFKKRSEKVGIPGLENYMILHVMKKDSKGKYVLKFDKKNIAPKTPKENIERGKYLWKTATQVKVPTLYIKAEKSEIFNKKTVSKLKKAIPAMDYQEIEGATHELVFTHPDILAETIHGYLESSVN